MSFHPQFGDIAHLGHVELLTPKFAESVNFFSNVLGLSETYRSEHSVYFRAWADYESCTLKISDSDRSGLRHIGLRVRNQTVLEQLVHGLEDSGIRGEWQGHDLHHGLHFVVQIRTGTALSCTS